MGVSVLPDGTIRETLDHEGVEVDDKVVEPEIIPHDYGGDVTMTDVVVEDGGSETNRLDEDVDMTDSSEMDDVSERPHIDCTMNTPLKVEGATRRITKFSLRNSTSYMLPPAGINYVFVQGKEWACIATCDLVQDSAEIFESLESHIISLADSQLLGSQISPNPKEPIEPCAAVSGPFYSGKKKGSTSASARKAMRFVHPMRLDGERAAIGVLMEKLREGCTDTFSGTVQAALTAVQCLYLENLKPKEIEVYAIRSIGGDGKLLERGEIAEHLSDSSAQRGEVLGLAV